MPHLHLSLQSGDDIILKRMKRRHTRADAIRFCDRLRRLRPDIVFGADIIAGFPTETEQMFENSLSIIADCGLTFPACLPLLVAERHASRAHAADRPETYPRTRRQTAGSWRGGDDGWMASEVGRTRRVLVEGRGRGHTEHFAPVDIDAGQRGEIVSAQDCCCRREAPVGSGAPGSGVMAEPRRGFLGRLFRGEAQEEPPTGRVRREARNRPKGRQRQSSFRPRPFLPRRWRPSRPPLPEAGGSG